MVIDYRNPKKDPTVEMTGIGGYPVSTPGANNSNMMPNQINNPVVQPYYNPGIPPNYNSGMAKNTPENYSSSGNIYANTNNINIPENNMDCQTLQDPNNENDAK